MQFIVEDLALQLLQALRQRFPDHFKERESQLHLVDVFPGQTEEEALTMYMESHPDAMESDVYIFSWVTGVDDEDIYARGGNFTTPVFRDLEIAEMVRELEQAPPVQAPPVESDPDARPASLKGVPGWEVELMAVDGKLNMVEEEWISTRMAPSETGPRTLSVPLIASGGANRWILTLTDRFSGAIRVGINCRSIERRRCSLSGKEICIGNGKSINISIGQAVIYFSPACTVVGRKKNAVAHH